MSTTLTDRMNAPAPEGMPQWRIGSLPKVRITSGSATLAKKALRQVFLKILLCKNHLFLKDVTPLLRHQSPVGDGAHSDDPDQIVGNT
jgi:hypothetical protein